MAFVAMVFLLIAIPAACGFAPPDWEAFYAERLGQSVIELDRSSLGEAYLDPAQRHGILRPFTSSR
jgi:hypothetical protein